MYPQKYVKIKFSTTSSGLTWARGNTGFQHTAMGSHRIGHFPDAFIYSWVGNKEGLKGEAK